MNKGNRLAAFRIVCLPLLTLIAVFWLHGLGYAGDITVGEILQVTTEPAFQAGPAVAGDLIVWEDQRDQDLRSEVYLYDVAVGSETRLLPNVHVSGVDISGSRIAYREFFTGEGIFVYDLVTQANTFIGKGNDPKISGERLAFIAEGSGSKTLNVYDLETGVTAQVGDLSSVKLDHDISGNHVVWADYRNGNYDIFVYYLDTGVERQVTTDPTQQTRPAISGDRVVWIDNRHGAPEVYLYDLVLDVETRLAPGTKALHVDISGDLIVYQAELSNANDEIFLHDISTGETYQLTNDPADQVTPKIDGNRVAWAGADAGSWDIYTVELSEASFEQISTLINDLVEEGSVDSGVAVPASSLADQAAASVEQDRTDAAVAKLNAFVRYVNAQSGRGIDSEAAATLVAQAESVIASLSQ